MALDEKYALRKVAEHAERTNNADFKSNLEQMEGHLQAQLNTADRLDDEDYDEGHAESLEYQISVINALKRGSASSPSSQVRPNVGQVSEASQEDVASGRGNIGEPNFPGGTEIFNPEPSESQATGHPNVGQPSGAPSQPPHLNSNQRSSVIDDFADTSLEFMSYTDGDD